jgi:hypothetical protein
MEINTISAIPAIFRQRSRAHHACSTRHSRGQNLLELCAGKIHLRRSSTPYRGHGTLPVCRMCTRKAQPLYQPRQEFGDARNSILAFMERAYQESMEIFGTLTDVDLHKKCSTPGGAPITTWK